MTGIRVSGPEELARQMMKEIERIFPDCYDRMEYPDRDVPGDINIYVKVREPEQQTIGGVPQDHQIIGYCRAWRSKKAVGDYFNMSFEAVSEILERLTNSGALHRKLVDKHYEYIDMGKCANCFECAFCVYDETEEERVCIRHENIYYGRTVYLSDHIRQCDRFIPKEMEE